MLDLGFEPAIRALANRTRADRQTSMFSATWPSAIQRLAGEFLAGPAHVTIGSLALSAAHSVTQVVEVRHPAHEPPCCHFIHPLIIATDEVDAVSVMCNSEVHNQGLPEFKLPCKSRVTQTIAVTGMPTGL